MAISKKEVERVASLARLELSDNETQDYTEQLGSILNWMEELNKLDVSKVEPTAYVFPMSNVFREDKVTESLDVEKALQNAPDSKDSYFRVPKIV